MNIPVYLFLAWVAFDTKENAADTFFYTIVALLKVILIPRIVRMFMGGDEEEGLGMIQVAGYVIACGGVTWGEYLLIEKYLL